MSFNGVTCRREQISQNYSFVQRFQCHAVMRKKKLYGVDFFCSVFVFCLFLLPLKTVLAEALTHTYNLLAMKLRAQPTTPPTEHTHAYKYKHTRIQVQTHAHTSTNTHIQLQTHIYN